MAGIMDFFKTPANNQQQQQQGQQQQQQQGQGQQQGKENLSQNPPTTDANGKMPGTEPTNENPLDVYAKMFDNASKNTPEAAPKFTVDPNVLKDVSGKMDFTRGIAPELLQKATGGDINSMMEIIKTVGQNAYRASIEHNTALTDTYLSNRGEYDRKQLERGIHSNLTAAELSSAPNYQHPVVKQELNRIASQFSAANPDASPQEIAQAAKKYMDDLHAALNPSTKEANKQTEEMDWSKYLNQ